MCMKYGVIYKITNPNNHSYIGQSTSWHKRYNKYKNLNCKDQPILYRSFQKHSFENHTFEILMQNIPIEQLSAWERAWIWAKDTFGTNGLNLTDGGDGGSEKGKNNPNFGKRHSKETKEKISKSRIGQLRSEETRKKMSQNHADYSGQNHPRFGTKHSEETKRKISETKKRKSTNV